MKEKGGRINWLIRHMMLITGLVLAVLLLFRGAAGTGRAAGRERLTALINDQADAGLEWIWRMNYPAAGRAEENETKMVKAEEESISGLICRFIFGQSPLYRYLGREEGGEINYKEEDPAFAGYLESGKFYEEHQYLMYDGGEETGAGTMEQAGTTVLAANGDGAGGEGTSGAPGTTAGGNAGNDENAGAVENAGMNGNAAALPKKDDNMTCAASVLPLIGTTYRKEQLADYDYMMKHFYSVHTSTTAGRDLMKADEFLAKDFTLEGSNDKPQILIYHTHSQEEFSDYGPDNKEATVIGIGNYLTELLTAKGYHVIHDKSVYDLQNGKLDRNKAYTYALDGVTRILQENPSIEVILDLHRDGVNESLHLVNEVNGKPTAPIMFFNGVSQTPEGPIEYLPNPYRSDNLAFSFQMQLDAAAYFPGLTRKIYIKGLRYNLHLRPRSVLIEVGAQTNTYQEARNAMEPLAEVLNMVLQGN
ncbi:stage II sporulation protein P [Hungatella effluvii]|uniref:Stage II sporulation protein P n=1 Tax=Hungatella effluvii TaxID=1096246 RepID=A0A2V3Y5D0_9FIRM|nr:stage II sporulation protein P [Hungatella effluvii]PXX51725.1 stage II sporulation protein P [Hungatella effluvii]